MTRVLAVRLDNDGDVLLAGPAIRAVAAGADIVLTTGRGSWIRVYRALLERAQADRGFRARVRESAVRVIALRRTLG